MKFLFRYLKKYIKTMLLGVSIKTLGSVGELLIPYVLEHIIDDVVLEKRMEKVILWGIIMIALAFLVRWLNITANRKAVKVSAECNYDIRKDLFKKSINLSGNQIDEIGLPSLTARMTSDSYNLQNFVRSMQTMGIRAPILFVGGIGVTLVMDRRLSLILCVLSPLMIFFMVFISLKGVPFYEKVQSSVDNIVRVMRENITGIRVVKALSKEEYEKKRYEAVNTDLEQKDIRAGVIMALPVPLVNLVLNIGLTLIVLYGARLVNDGYTKPGVILAFLTYFNMIMNGTNGLSKIFIQASKANASALRIQSVVDSEDELQKLSEDELATTDKEGFIVFDHVSFKYGSDDPLAAADRENCLTDINFEIKKGGSLGIIGATGAGKTSIVNMLMRFYDTTDGHVFLDGKDVRGYEKDELHRKFGVVFQNDVLFADTLKNNILFGREVDETELIQATKDAQAYDFISQYKEGLDHESVIHGANLSGGQKQRVLISRALAAKPEILILDDSSSALDYKTDAALRKAVHDKYNCTTIVIAQRVSSIMNLDEIIIIDDGKILDRGTHDELLNRCSVYQDIYTTQMGV